MTTRLITHSDCLNHDTSPGHPECADRLRAVLAALDTDEFADLQRAEAPLATEEQILRVHSRELIDHVRGVAAMAARDGYARIDADTIASEGSYVAALRAAGSVCAGVDAVMAGEAGNVFCAVRPPGHHAEPAAAMGFCLFNSIAVGAQHARAAHRLRRIAVVDFDVHHGNGTQAAFQSDAALFYVSLHQSPLYPGTGDAHETGVGNIVNLPLAAGSGSAQLQQAVEGAVLPALRSFEPEMLMISAGFDGHKADPLAGLNYETQDYFWVTDILLDLADEICDGRVVSALEGGYNLVDLGESAAAHMRALMRHGTRREDG